MLTNKRLGNVFVSTLILLGVFLVISPDASGQGLGGDNKDGEKWNERRKHRLDNYRDETGRLRPDLRKKGITKLKQMPIAAGVPADDGAALVGPAGLEGPGLTGVQWVQIGPQPAVPLRQFNFQGFGPISGEVVDIAIDPRGTSDNVIYIATNQGGVWRSLDGGVTFTARTDYLPTLSIGAVALDNGNPSIVYAGTGNLFDGNGNRWQTSPTVGQTPNAIGIYKSSDMGQTWSIVNPGNIFDSVGFGRMVSTSPGVLSAGTSAGLFRSVDYGENFGNNAPEFDNGQPSRAGNITDLDIDVGFDTTGVVYVSVFGVGVLAYNDGDTSLPSSFNILTSTNGGPANSIQFLRFAQAESDPMRMYATVEGFATNDHEVADTAPSGGADRFEGLYRSDDGGANWTRLDGSGSAEGAAERNGSRGCQCGYDQTVAVDPQDPDTVYIGFQAAFKSTDGGVSFGLSPAMSDDKIHWDQHAHYFSPPAHRSGGAPTRMWMGSDGGLHSSSDGGATFNNDHNITIASNLFTDMDMGYGSPANNAFTYGGTQDTGTLQTHPGVSNAPSAERWDMGINGDGGGVGVDTANAGRAYSSGNNGYQVTTDGGANWSTPGGYVGPGTVWRYAIDYSDANNVFMVEGGNAGFDPDNDLHRSTDQGTTVRL